jgi:hypothetical protein
MGAKDMDKRDRFGAPPDGAGASDDASLEATGDVVLDPKIQEAIGRSLKAHYHDIAQAPVPDRFLALLAELEAKEQSNAR